MRLSAYLIAATAAVTMLLLLSGCEKAERPQQGAQQQQGIVSEAAEAEAPDSQAAENLSDGIDDALAELDILKGLEG